MKEGWGLTGPRETYRPGQWKEPRNRRASDAEKKAPYPILMLAARGDRAHVVFTWNLLVVEGIGMRRKGKKDKQLPNCMLEQRERPEVRVNVGVDQPVHAGMLVSGRCTVIMYYRFCGSVSQLLAARSDGSGTSLHLLPACPCQPVLPSPVTFPGGSRDRMTMGLGQWVFPPKIRTAEESTQNNKR